MEKFMGFLSFVMFMQAMVFGGFCAYLASEKNRSGVSWFFLGFLFSFLALIAIAASGVANQQSGQTEEESMRKCPYCAEMVKGEAKICRFCQHELPALITSKNSDLAVTEEGLMKRYNVIKDGEQYIFLTHKGFHSTEIRTSFLGLKEGIEKMYGVTV